MAAVNNDRLVPYNLDPNAVFASSNTSSSDTRNPVSDYKKAVQMVLENPADKESLTKALQEFQASMVVEELIEKLKEILDAPNKRILYKYISPLIPHRLRPEYKSLVPHIPAFEKKMVRLKQTGSQPFGFTVRGGKEFNCGIFVVKVMASSKAALNGLKPGDQIIRINGLTLSDSTHKEFIDLVKLRKSLALTVKSVGLVPEIKSRSKKVTWKAVGEQKTWISRTRIGIHGPIRRTRRIQVNIQKGESLGANVKISSAIDAGVLIVDISPNSPAHIAGLKPGDEILEVNGRSLIGKPHDQAIAILRSSNTLMMTIRADRVMSRDSTVLSEFDFTTHEHDTDAQIISGIGGRQQNNGGNETFELRARQDEVTRRNKKQKQKLSVTSGNRVSVLDTEVLQSHHAPTIASPAALGYGPSLALPTLQQMSSGTERMDYGPDTEFPLSMSGGMNQSNSNGGEGGRNSQQLQRSSRPVSDRVSTSSMVPPTIGQATVDGNQAKKKVSTGSQQQDLSLYQFPVDNDDHNNGRGGSSRGGEGSRKASSSAMKKTGSTSVVKNRRPTFSEDVEIIPRNKLTENKQANNYTFSEEILNGRKVAVHSIPKDGPLRLAIRGGKDTPLGPQIIISRIMEDGAADRYGRLNIGDQVLVIDGVSLIDVTHDDAGIAFKNSMERNSQFVELVVAVNPETK